MFERIKKVKSILIIIAIIIAVASLFTSRMLTNDLKVEEKKSVELLAEVYKSFDPSYEGMIQLKIMEGNTTIPVILIDKNGNYVSHRNFKPFKQDEDSVQYLQNLAKKLKDRGNSVKIIIPKQEQIVEIAENENQMDEAQVENDSLMETNLANKTDTGIFKTDEIIQEDDYQEICYDDSLMLKRLTVYPYVQLAVVIIFVIIAIFALLSMMKSEQNKVWVGLSKETAHQLGTPISSLMAWTTVLKEAYPQDQLIPEMENDVNRLERIAQRFSKIGSIPEPKPEDLCEVLNRVVAYMKKRVSNKVEINAHFPDEPIIVNMVAPLFEWVGENLCKNAVDAMAGTGKIDIFIFENDNNVAVEVKDNGKGIQKNHFKSVFKPGFTTKERGWGLGLSLAKRIIEEYHKGHIFVKSSEIGVGTTFKIELPK